MAFTIRGHNAASTTLGSSGGSVNLPVTANAGDLILVHVGVHNAGTSTTVSATGYTQIDIGGNNATAGTVAWAGYKVAAGGETTASITIGGTAGINNGVEIMVIAAGGFDATTPINVHTSGASASGSAGPTLSFSTTVDHCGLVYVWNIHNGTSASSTVPTNPNASWVQEERAAANDLLFEYWNPDAGTAGSTGNVIPSVATSFNGHGAVMYAIAPPAGTTFTKSLSGAISSSGALAKSRVATKALAGAITPTASVGIVWTPSFSSGEADDPDRFIDGPSQDIRITFTSSLDPASLPALGGSLTGHTIKVNGTSYTPTYQGRPDFPGSVQLKVRIPVLVHQGDTVTYSYSRASGSTMGMSGDELKGVTDAAITNNVHLHIYFTLRDHTNTPIASTIVTASFHVLDPFGGDPTWSDAQGHIFGQLIRADFVTTDPSGTFDWTYVATAPGATNYAPNWGDSLLVVVLSPRYAPTESFAWMVALV